VTLILDFDLNVLKFRCVAAVKFVDQGFQKSESEQDRQTDRHVTKAHYEWVATKYLCVSLLDSSCYVVWLDIHFGKT